MWRKVIIHQLFHRQAVAFRCPYSQTCFLQWLKYQGQKNYFVLCGFCIHAITSWKQYHLTPREYSLPYYLSLNSEQFCLVLALLAVWLIYSKWVGLWGICKEETRLRTGVRVGRGCIGNLSWTVISTRRIPWLKPGVTSPLTLHRVRPINRSNLRTPDTIFTCVSLKK